MNMDSARTVICAAQRIAGTGRGHQFAFGGLQTKVIGRNHHMAAQRNAVLILEDIALHCGRR